MENVKIKISSTGKFKSTTNRRELKNIRVSSTNEDMKSSKSPIQRKHEKSKVSSTGKKHEKISKSPVQGKT